MKGSLNEDTVVPEAEAAAGVSTITNSTASTNIGGDNAAHDAVSALLHVVSRRDKVSDGEKEIAKPAAQEPEQVAAPQDVLKTLKQKQTLNDVPPNLTNLPLVVFEIVLSNLTAAEILRVTTSISKTLCSSEERSGSAERSAELALRSIVRRSWSRLDARGTSDNIPTRPTNQVYEESGLPDVALWPDTIPVESIERHRRSCQFRICQDESLLRTYHLHNALYRRAMQVAAEEARIMHRPDADHDHLDSLVVAPLTWLVLGAPILPPLTRVQFRALSVSSSDLIGLLVPWNDLAERHAADPDPSPSYLRAVREAALATHSAPRLLLLADRMRKVGLSGDCRQLCNVLLYGHRAPRDVVEFWSSSGGGGSGSGEEVEPCYLHDEYFLGHDVVVTWEGSSLHGRRGTVERLYDGQDIGVRLPREGGKENHDHDDDHGDDHDDDHEVHYLRPSQLVRSIPDRRLELDLIICTAMAVNGDADVDIRAHRYRFPDHAASARNIHLLRDRSKAMISFLAREDPADDDEEETPISKRNSCVVHRYDQERLFFAYHTLITCLVQHGYAVGIDDCPPGLHGVLPTDEIFRDLYRISSPRVLPVIVADWFLKEARSNEQHMDLALQLLASKHYYVMLADAVSSQLRAAAGFLSAICAKPMLLKRPPSLDVQPRIVAHVHLMAAAEKLRTYFEIIVEKVCRLQSKKVGVETIIRPSLDVLCQTADYPIATSLAMVAHELYKLYSSASAMRFAPFRKPLEFLDMADFLRFSAALSLRSLGRGHPLSVGRVELLVKERAALCTISTTLYGQSYCYFPTGGLEQMEEKVNKWLGNYQYDRFLYSKEYFETLDSSGNATLS